MKKIILFFLVALLCNFSYAQFPITQNLGAPKTLVVNKGGFQSDTTLILPTFNDTTAANQSTLVKTYPGNLIRIKDTLYFRNKTATAWVKLATGNGSGVNIYNSDGTLTANRTVSLGNRTLSFLSNSNTSENLSINPSTKVSSFGGDSTYLKVSYAFGDKFISLEADTTLVNGKLRILDGSEDNGYVLTSDARGVATWQKLDAGSGTVTSISQGYGIINSTNPITTTGTIKVDTTKIATHYYVDSSISTIAIPTLQEVLDNNHDLINNVNLQGTGSGVANTGVNINSFGGAALENNIGNDVNAFGNSSGRNNNGNDVNAMGTGSANSNDGFNVNAFGYEAGISNVYGNVNLFGRGASATDSNQTSLAGSTYQARIDYNRLTSNQKYDLPDSSGTIALLSNIPASSGTVTSISQGYGITNSTNPITTTGTISVDTTVSGLSGKYVRINDTANRYVNTITRTLGKDSIIYFIGSTRYAIKDSVGTNPAPVGYYGAFQDNTSQTAASINTAYPVKFNTTDLTNGVSIVNDGSSNPTRVTLANTGIYNIQFSLQLEKTGGSGNMIADIWIRKNGVNIPSTTGKVVLTGSANASPIVAAWNYVLDLAAGDYVQLMWSTSNTNVEIVAAGATSPHPAIPSSILTVTQQSGIMAGTGITAINNLTGAAQTIVAGTSGTDFAVSSVGTTHTLNLPSASASARGALSSANWSTFNGKQDSGVVWKTSGNNNITASQFIGSTNNASLIFKTNNVESMVLDSVGRIQLKSFANNGTYTNAFQLANTNNRSFFNVNTNSSVSQLSLKSNNNAVGDSMIINDSGLIAPRTNATLWLKPSQSGTYNVVANRCAGCGTGSIFSANAGTSAPVFNVSSTGATSIGASSSAASSLVDMSSTSLGLLIPRMTTTQRDAISSPASQLLVSNTTKKTLDQYNGTTWNSIAGDFNKDLLGLQALGSPVKSSPIGTQFMPATGGALVGSRSYYNAIVVDKEITITGAMWYQVTQGVYIGTGGNYNGIALYSQSGGTLTLVDSTARDTTIWKASSASWNQKAFAGGSRTLQPGVYYLLGLANPLAGNFVTAPSLGVWGAINPSGVMITNSARLYGGLASGATIPPTTQAMSAWNNFSIYFSLYLY